MKSQPRQHISNKYNTRTQGSGNFEIWIGPADDDDVISEPISKKKICIQYSSGGFSKSPPSRWGVDSGGKD